MAASGQSEAPLPHQEVESLKPSQVQRLQLDLRETDGTERSRGNGSHVTPRRNATRSRARAGGAGGGGRSRLLPRPFFYKHAEFFCSENSEAAKSETTAVKTTFLRSDVDMKAPTDELGFDLPQSAQVLFDYTDLPFPWKQTMPVAE